MKVCGVMVVPGWTPTESETVLFLFLFMPLFSLLFFVLLIVLVFVSASFSVYFLRFCHCRVGARFGSCMRFCVVGVPFLCYPVEHEPVECLHIQVVGAVVLASICDVRYLSTSRLCSVHKAFSPLFTFLTASKCVPPVVTTGSVEAAYHICTRYQGI